MKVNNALPTGSTLTITETQVYNAAPPIAWTDLDLSAVIGPNQALVILKISSAIGDQAKAVRKNGDTDQFYNVFGSSCALTTIPQAGIHSVFIVLTDSNGIIEWITESAQALTVDIMGYIK